MKSWQDQSELWGEHDDETLGIAYSIQPDERSPHEALCSILNSYVKDERVGKAKVAAGKLRDQSKLLGEILSHIINRKTFGGTCRICKDFS